MKIFKKHRKKRLIICIILVVFIVIAMYNGIEITHYSTTSPKINTEITIALVADLHCTNYGKNQHRLIEKIKEGKPDLILLAGDTFHHFGARTKGHELIAESVKIAPVYFVAGNHEKSNPEYHEILEEVKRYGGIVLDNEAVLLTLGDSTINLAGGDDSIAVKKSAVLSESADYSYSADCPYRIMLNHYPEDYRPYTDNFDMMMSGHVHGGQIRIPWIMPNGPYAPGQGFFPKYTGGMYQITDDFTLVVSRGISKRRSGRFRVFNRPELVFVTISPIILSE